MTRCGVSSGVDNTDLIGASVSREGVPNPRALSARAAAAKLPACSRTVWAANFEYDVSGSNGVELEKTNSRSDPPWFVVAEWPSRFPGRRQNVTSPREYTSVQP